MPSPAWIRITIGLFALLIVALAAITGKTIDEDGLRWAAGASGVVILALLAFDRWIWRWPGVRWLSERTGARVIYGTWRGEIIYTADGEGNPGRTDVYMAVYQTYSLVKICCYFPATGSVSESLSADLTGETHRHLLRYHYDTKAPVPDRDRNRPTAGACELAVVGRPVEEIRGDYYAERGGKGTIAFDGYCSKLAGSASHAARFSYRDLPQ